MEWLFGARVSVVGNSVEPFAAEIRDWVLGFRSFAKKRDNRLSAGVSPKWHPEDLTHGTFRGTNECKIDVRSAPNRFLVHLTHRDDDNPAILWHSVIDLDGGRTAGDIAYTHGVARSLPTGMSAPPRAGAPAVYKTIIKLAQGNVAPRDAAVVKPHHLNEDDVEQFVSHVLLDRSRQLPVLVLAPTDSGPVVDAGRIGPLLLGQAQIAVLPTTESTFTLTNGLVSAGYSRKLTCFDGAARLYLPKMDPAETVYRHRLWLRTELEQAKSDVAAALAGRVAERIARTVLPDGLLEIVEEFDRAERKTRTTALLDASKQGTIEQTVDAPQLRDENAQLRSSLAELKKDFDDFLDAHEKTWADLKESQDRAEEKDDELRQERYEHEQLQRRARQLGQELDARKVEQASQLHPDTRRALAAFATQSAKLADVLKAIEFIFADRLIVLDSAHASAKDSEKFQFVPDATRLLVRLAGAYFDALTSRGGDTEARKVFGKNDFAATESESTVMNARARELRTFIVNGTAYEMWSHLKIGGKPSVAETWRCHFVWLPSERKIAVGWCGGHLDLR